jgi:hypothetical protein
VAGGKSASARRKVSATNGSRNSAESGVAISCWLAWLLWLELGRFGAFQRLVPADSQTLVVDRRVSVNKPLILLRFVDSVLAEHIVNGDTLTRGMGIRRDVNQRESRPIISVNQDCSICGCVP